MTPTQWASIDDATRAAMHKAIMVTGVRRFRQAEELLINQSTPIYWEDIEADEEEVSAMVTPAAALISFATTKYSATVDSIKDGRRTAHLLALGRLGFSLKGYNL